MTRQLLLDDHHATSRCNHGLSLRPGRGRLVAVFLALMAVHCATGSTTDPYATAAPSSTGDAAGDSAGSSADVSQSDGSGAGGVDGGGIDASTADDAAWEAGGAGDGGSLEAGSDGSAPDVTVDSSTAEAGVDGATVDVGVVDATDAPDAWEAGLVDASGSDAGSDGGTTITPLVCEDHTWNEPVPAAGSAMMAYGGKAYLFSSNGLSWAIIENETAQTQPIPLPSGVTEMRSVKAEIAPSGRPFLTFRSDNQVYGAFFDGQHFVKTTLLGSATSAHADAQERIYALTQNGLTEFVYGQSPIIRGSFPPNSGNGWTVGADGRVYVMYTENRPSTIHPGDTAIDLRLKHLDHGTLSWAGDALITSNEGWGFGQLPFVVAPDGSLHTAYSLTYEAYYFRSVDGETWERETFKDIISTATLVDIPSGGYGPELKDVEGSILTLAAQDYDHVSITLVDTGTSFYFLRRCPPFTGSSNTWPAERLSYTYPYSIAAVNESGLASILTADGVRQDVWVP
jgi:hypothetical protein